MVGGARGVDVEQLGGHLEQLLLHPRLAQREGAAAQPVEPDGVGGGPGELLHLAELRDREVEPVGPLVVEHEEVALDPADLHLGEPAVAGDAVLHVDHEVALVQVPEAGHHGVLDPGGARALAHAPSQDLLVGDQRHPALEVHEAAGEVAGHEMDVDGRVPQSAQVARRGGVDPHRQPAILEQAPQPVRRGGGVGGDHRGHPAGAPFLEPAHQRRERALVAVRGLDLPADGGGVPEREADGLGHPQEDPVAAQGRQRTQEVRHLAGAEEVGRRRQRQLVPAQRGGVLPFQLGVEVGKGPVHAVRIVDEERDLSGQVGEQGGEPPVVEAGEERLHAEEGGARLDGVDDLAHLGGGAGHLLGQRAHRPHGGRLSTYSERSLPGRHHHQLLDVAERSLGPGLEGPRALHLVAEELEPDRPVVERAPDVDHRAPHRERPGILDQRHPRVPELDEAPGEQVPVHREPLAEELQAPPQLGAGDVASRQRARRHHHRPDVRAGEVEPGERRQPVHLQAAIGGEVVVGEHGIGRDPHHRRGARSLPAEEEGEIPGEQIGLLLVDGDGEEHALPPTGSEEPQRREATGRAGEADHVGAAGGHGVGDGAPGSGCVLGHGGPVLNTGSPRECPSDSVG